MVNNSLFPSFFKKNCFYSWNTGFGIAGLPPQPTLRYIPQPPNPRPKPWRDVWPTWLQCVLDRGLVVPLVEGPHRVDGGVRADPQGHDGLQGLRFIGKDRREHIPLDNYHTHQHLIPGWNHQRSSSQCACVLGCLCTCVCDSCFRIPPPRIPVVICPRIHICWS